MYIKNASDVSDQWEGYLPIARYYKGYSSLIYQIQFNSKFRKSMKFT